MVKFNINFMKIGIVLFIFLLFISLLYVIMVFDDDNNINKDINNDVKDNSKKGLVCLAAVSYNDTGEISAGSTGTGFIVNDGVIITASHIIRKDNSLHDEVYFDVGCNNGKMYEVDKMYTYELTDTAVLEYNEDDVNTSIETYSIDVGISHGQNIKFKGYHDENVIVGEGVINNTNIRDSIDLDVYPPGLFLIKAYDQNKVKKGISGGPILDDEGNILGMSIARTDNNTILAIRYSIINSVVKGLQNETSDYTLPKLPIKTSENIKGKSKGLIIIDNPNNSINKRISMPRYKKITNEKTLYGYGTIITSIDGIKIHNKKQLRLLLYIKYNTGDKVKLNIHNQRKGSKYTVKVQLTGSENKNIFK